MADRGLVRSRTQAARVIAAGLVTVDGKPAVIVATNDASRAAGMKAGALAKLAAGVLGGGGGGRDDLAQGGGSDVSEIGNALAAISASVAG